MTVEQLGPVDPEALAPEADGGNTAADPEVDAANADADTTQPEKDADGHALPPDIQAKVNGRIGKYAARAKTAEEKATALTTEMAELKKQLEETQGKVSDETVLRAAANAGVLQEYATKADGELFAKAEKAQAQRMIFRNAVRSGGYTGKNSRGEPLEMTAEECQEALDYWDEQLDDLKPQAQTRMREIARTIKADNELGRAARKAKWAPGTTVADPKAGNKPPAAPPNSPESPEPTRRAAAPQVDFSTADSTQSLAELISKSKLRK